MVSIYCTRSNVVLYVDDVDSRRLLRGRKRKRVQLVVWPCCCVCLSSFLSLAPNFFPLGMKNGEYGGTVDDLGVELLTCLSTVALRI